MIVSNSKELTFGRWALSGAIHNTFSDCLYVKQTKGRDGERGAIRELRRRSDADRVNPASYAGSSGRQSDDSAIYALGDDFEAPPQLTPLFVQFLRTRAAVPLEFLNDVEQSYLFWYLTSFMRLFSKGSHFDIAEKLGVDFVMKHSVQISRIHVLYLFLRENPLEMEKDSDVPDYKSFDKEAHRSFLTDYRRLNKEAWDTAVSNLIE